jgi:hypothetical protein
MFLNLLKCDIFSSHGLVITWNLSKDFYFERVESPYTKKIKKPKHHKGVQAFVKQECKITQASLYTPVILGQENHKFEASLG